MIPVSKDPRGMGLPFFGVAGDRLFQKANAGGTRIAFLPGRDDLLEKLWRQRGSLGGRLRDLGYASVVAPSFSTYWDRTPFDGLFEISRTMEVAAELSGHLPVTPCIAWRNWKDLERWVEWLEESKISAVAMHLSDLRSGAEWDWAKRGIREFRALLGNPITRLLAYGPSTPKRILDVANAWGTDVMIASQTPMKLAVAHRSLTENLEKEEPCDLLPEELARVNVAHFEHAVSSILERESVARLRAS